MLSPSNIPDAEKPLKAMVVFLLLLLPALLFSQPHKPDTVKTGKVEVIADRRIDSLVRREVAYNEWRKGVPGYRVQLFFGSHKKDALEVKSQFMKIHSDAEVYIIYDQPYFKVRAGDFFTRLDAIRFLKEISVSFPNAFVVKDDVEVTDEKKRK